MADNTEDFNLEDDSEVEKMMEEWDLVECRFCKKMISMIKADLVDESYFVCKEHNGYEPK